MFQVLLESQHVRPRRPVVAAAVSAVAHVAAVVAVMGGAAVATREDLHPIWEELARRFLAPPVAQPVAGGEQLSFVTLNRAGARSGEQEGKAEKVNDDALVGIPVIAQKVVEPVDVEGPMLLAKAAEQFGAFTITSVDSAAERDPRGVAPEYPPAMLAQNIEGSAVFRFVIDSTGRVDLATVREMSATRKEFADAVRAAMPRMLFRPAMRNRVSVRQMVEQPFVFRIAIPPPPRAPAVAPRGGN
ncbi:MAG: TonB family protein [Gemmatimonadaceae bacterium]|nr:TonB family protein [Gemmatimonadaceae bacterium]